MLTKDDVYFFLEELEKKVADELESRMLECKRWKKSLDDSMKKIIEYVVCMGSCGGGIVIFRVQNNILGRENAITGVPKNLDISILMQRVYEKTDPHITPFMELIDVPEGTGKILLMNIFPGLPPY